jgi:hypothetical protein
MKQSRKWLKKITRYGTARMNVIVKSKAGRVGFHAFRLDVNTRDIPDGTKLTFYDAAAVKSISLLDDSWALDSVDEHLHASLANHIPCTLACITHEGKLLCITTLFAKHSDKQV